MREKFIIVDTYEIEVLKLQGYDLRHSKPCKYLTVLTENYFTSWLVPILNSFGVSHCSPSISFTVV